MMRKQNAGLTFLMLILISVVFFSVISGCRFSENKEPPQDFGKAKPGELVRVTKLIDIKFSEGRIMYEVQYPRHGLTSIAILSFPYKSLLEETFPKKWRIIYEYNDRWLEYEQIPSAYTIYGYSQSTEKYDRLINKYTLVKVESGHLFYQDTSGKIRVRDPLYFSIAPPSF